VNVRGWKSEIDGTDWLCTTVEHSLDYNGLTMRMEVERASSDELKADKPRSCSGS
jgi:phage protein D